MESSTSDAEPPASTETVRASGVRVFPAQRRPRALTTPSATGCADVGPCCLPWRLHWPVYLRLQTTPFIDLSLRSPSRWECARYTTTPLSPKWLRRPIDRSYHMAAGQRAEWCLIESEKAR